MALQIAMLSRPHKTWPNNEAKSRCNSEWLKTWQRSDSYLPPSKADSCNAAIEKAKVRLFSQFREKEEAQQACRTKTIITHPSSRSCVNMFSLNNSRVLKRSRIISELARFGTYSSRLPKSRQARETYFSKPQTLRRHRKTSLLYHKWSKLHQLKKLSSESLHSREEFLQK